MCSRLVVVVLLFVSCGRPAVSISMNAELEALTTADITSYELWIYGELGRDGQPIDCQALVARTIGPADPNLIPLKDPIKGNFGSGQIDVKDIAKGNDNRIFYVDLYGKPVDNLAPRIGAGCKAGVSINASSTVTVDITVSTPPAIVP